MAADVLRSADENDDFMDEEAVDRAAAVAIVVASILESSSLLLICRARLAVFGVTSSLGMLLLLLFLLLVSNPIGDGWGESEGSSGIGSGNM